MNEKTVSMQKIAKQLGISKVSVSKAINNQAGISEDLRKKILDVAYESGYITEKKVPADSCVKKFAFLTPKRYFFENENFYSQIFYYLNKECISNNIDLLVFIINSEDEKSLAIPTILNNKNFDGIFVGGELENTYLHSLLNLKMPMVLIDFYKPDIDLDCILVDNFYASYVATTYLIQNGHNKIGFVGNPQQASSIADRFFGYQKALAQYKLDYKPEWSITNNDPISGFYSADIDLPSKLPTAFICYCDTSAFFLIKKLETLGLRVPEDISIVSFDNTEISQNCNPPLTTIDISKKSFAVKAFEQMVYRIENKELPSQRIFINTKMIKRDSVNQNTPDSPVTQKLKEI